MANEIVPYEGTFTGYDGTQLYCKRYIVENPKATLVIVHGLGEHAGRYTNVINKFLPDYNIFLYDLRGHGHSEGKMGHVDRFDQYIEDTKIFVENAKDRTKLPVVLLGHSMGGLIVLLFAEKYPDLIKMVVASSPGVGIAVPIPKWKDIMGKLISNIIPKFSMVNEIDTSWISHDSEVVKAYENDPLVNDKVSARWFTEFIKGQKEVLDNSYKLTLPLIIMQAGDDKLVNPEKSKELYEKAASKDKTFKLYPGFYHEIFNEVEKEKPLEDARNWVDERVK